MRTRHFDKSPIVRPFASYVDATRLRSVTPPRYQADRSAAPVTPHLRVQPQRASFAARPPLAHMERRTQVSDSLSLGSGRHHLLPAGLLHCIVEHAPAKSFFNLAFLALRTLKRLASRPQVRRS
jgi:hypothetical protein